MKISGKHLLSDLRRNSTIQLFNDFHMTFKCQSSIALLRKIIGYGMLSKLKEDLQEDYFRC